MATRQPVVLVPGMFAPATTYRNWVEQLEAAPYNFQVTVVDIKPGLWTGTTLENFGLALRAITTAAEQALEDSGADKIKLVGHSAGGRLARLWLSDISYNNEPCGGHQLTDTLIMLGAANQTKEPWSKKSVAWANKHAPGAYFPHIKYVTVIGKAVFGRFGLRPEENLAAINYRVQNGSGAQWGDGVIPVVATELDGATNLILDGIWHGSILGKPGYDSPDALKQWARFL